MKDILWNKIRLAEFKFLNILTDDETHVLDRWARGMSNVRISQECHMSERTVQNIISRLRQMYDACQPYSAILPERNV